jgi:6,7-dimethyl-8-ribityllumazine synthase
MPKVIEGEMAGGGGRYAVVTAKFNRTITGRLEKGAVKTLLEQGIDENDITSFWVPGAFELPMIADRLASSKKFDAVICLGAVIRGETTHDQHINRAISLQFADLSIKHGLPIIFGVLTCNTVEQANARSGGAPNVKDKSLPEGKIGNKGSEAAEAALEMVDLLRKLK